MDMFGVLLGLGILALVLVLQGLRKKPAPAEPVRFQIGNISAESLAYYCGYDFMKPILIAVKGVVYDATNRADLYGPGGWMPMAGTCVQVCSCVPAAQSSTEAHTCTHIHIHIHRFALTGTLAWRTHRSACVERMPASGVTC